MANPWDDLKGILSDELLSTIGKLWNTEQDTAFLKYNAEKLAKYVTIYKDPSADKARRDEAKFNLDMLQASVVAYAPQKAITTGQGIEETAQRVLALVVGILIKAV